MSEETPEETEYLDSEYAAGPAERRWDKVLEEQNKVYKKIKHYRINPNLKAPSENPKGTING